MQNQKKLMKVKLFKKNMKKDELDLKIFKNVAILLTLVLLPALIQAQNYSDTELDNFNYGDLALQLNYTYSNTSLTLDNIKRLLYSKCEKLRVSDPNMIDHITEGANEFRQCINSLINLSEIYTEFESAPVGTLDIVFGKYCARRSMIFQCFRDFNAKFIPCLSQEEKVQNYVIMRIAYTLLEFFCDHSGSSVILFISQNGLECLESQKQHIIDCINTTLQDYVPEKGKEFLLEEVPELVLHPKQCLEIYDLERCVIQHMDHCAEITPSNMAEAIFRYVRKETKCQKEIDKVQQKLQLTAAAAAIVDKYDTRSGSNATKLSSFILLLSSCYLLFKRFIIAITINN